MFNVRRFTWTKRSCKLIALNKSHGLGYENKTGKAIKGSETQPESKEKSRWWKTSEIVILKSDDFCVCIGMYMYMHMQVHIYMKICICKSILMCMCTRMYICICICICIRTYIYIYRYQYIYIDKNIYRYMHMDLILHV